MNDLCEKKSQSEPLCEITSSLIDEAVNTILEFESADEKISEFITWQETEQGKIENLPRIEASHKEILFSEWETQMIKEERATSRARTIMDNLTQLVNDNLYAANLISDCTPGKLSKVKEIDKIWKQDLISKDQQINKTQEITWDALWSHLIKPHSQQMATKCLSNAINYIIPEFSDATYTSQLHSRLSHPTEVKDMLKICQFHTLDIMEIQ